MPSYFKWVREDRASGALLAAWHISPRPPPFVVGLNEVVVWDPALFTGGGFHFFDASVPGAALVHQHELEGTHACAVTLPPSTPVAVGRNLGVRKARAVLLSPPIPRDDFLASVLGALSPTQLTEHWSELVRLFPARLADAPAHVQSSAAVRQLVKERLDLELDLEEARQRRNPSSEDAR